MFAVKAKIYGVLYKQSSSIAFDETSSCWLAPKTPNFRVVHLPKITEISLITGYCSYARPAQPGPIRTRLCGPCIAAIDGY